MVNRNSSRGLIRTPRRTKAWASKVGLPPTSTGSITTSNPQVFMDLLSDYRSDMGISNTDRVTHMRTIGWLGLYDLGGATNNGSLAMAWGIGWVPGIVASAGAGDAQIPDPAEAGVRETQWIQRGVLTGTYRNALGYVAPMSENGENGWRTELDITQMRKQPTADSKLCLVVHIPNIGNGQVGLGFFTSTMIALS